MATNHASVKISADFLEEARAEAETALRSVGAQVEYWARLGRAVETMPGFTVERARAALTGQLKLEDMASAVEQDFALEQLAARFDAPDEAVRAHYAAIGARPGAAGSDGKGGVVRRQPRPRQRRAKA